MCVPWEAFLKASLVLEVLFGIERTHWVHLLGHPVPTAYNSLVNFCCDLNITSSVKKEYRNAIFKEKCRLLCWKWFSIKASYRDPDVLDTSVARFFIIYPSTNVAPCIKCLIAIKPCIPTNCPIKGSRFHPQV